MFEKISNIAKDIDLKQPVIIASIFVITIIILILTARSALKKQ